MEQDTATIGLDQWQFIYSLSALSFQDNLTSVVKTDSDISPVNGHESQLCTRLNASGAMTEVSRWRRGRSIQLSNHFSSDQKDT